jgi:hypothetical protein
VNVDGATAEAPLKVELLDRLGNPLPKFAGKNAAVITAGGTQVDLAWPAANNQPSPLDEPFAAQVRFPAQGDVRLYALYAEPIEE